jgi:transcriptional regulator with XRE-family HTH domain
LAIQHISITLRQEFGRQLRLARQAKNLTQAELAARVGSTQGKVSEIESGRGNPTLASCARLAHAVGCILTLTLAAQDT